MKIGYVRCSTVDQNPDRQIQMLRDAGCERIYQDMMSGKNTNRPKLLEMMDYVRDGDIVFVESISRLARSTRDLLNLIDEMNKKNVIFISQKEAIDTSTPQGKFMLTVFAAMAELERENILQRQAEGIAIAKAKGVYKGRKPKEYDRYLFEQLYKQWKQGNITQKYMSERLGMSKSTLKRIIASYKKNDN